MKRCKRLKSDLPELPDCVISYIFSKLSLKVSVKTSTLSKRWLHEWGFRMDLNFDFHNMFDFDFPNMFEFDNNTIMQKLQESFPLFESEFYTRFDQFMLHYAKGVKRIELLFTSFSEARYASWFAYQLRPSSKHLPRLLRVQV